MAEDPKSMAFFSNGNRAAIASDVAAVQKAAPTIYERFKSVMREREEDMSTEEIVQLYELFLSELTFNSKPIITDLTIIAGEQRDHAEGIADTICARIIEVPIEQKLPCLYLLDSIVKNIGQEYVKAFSSRLPEVFAEAYRQVHPSMYSSMRHLFGTWSTVFPLSVLHKIEAVLQFSPSGLTSLGASESPRPSHGIHVNPKYLEARRQFEDTPASNVPPRGLSSNRKTYGEKTTSGYDVYDSDNAEALSSHVPYGKMSSSSQTGLTSLPLGADRRLPSVVSRIAKSSSSFRIEHGSSESPQGDDVLAPYRLGRKIGREDQPTDKPMNFPSISRRLETSTVFNTRAELERPRALIDAYGNDQRNQTPSNKPLNVDTNGIGSEEGKKRWQNTEEEEFDWEDMSPTLVDCGRANGLPSSSIPPLESFSRAKPGYGTNNAEPFDTHLRRMNQFSQTPSSTADKCSTFTNDAVPTVNSGGGPRSKITGSYHDTTQFSGSHHPQEVRNFPHYLVQSSECPFNSEGSIRNFQTSGLEQKPFVSNFTDSDAQVLGSSAIAPRMGGAGVDPRKFEALPVAGYQATGLRSAVPLLPPLPLPSQSQSHSDAVDVSFSRMNQGLNKSSFPGYQFNSDASKALNSIGLPLFTNQQGGPLPPYQNKSEQVNPVQSLLPPQEIRPNLVLPSVVSMSPMVPPLPQGYNLQGHKPSGGLNVQSTPIPGVHQSFSYFNPPSSSMYSQRGPFPPFPMGPRPLPPQVLPPAQSSVPVAPNPQAGGAFSGLINSLMSHGLISLTQPAPAKESVGVDFNPDILKVRHESIITALYGDMPRQCRTCGLRFKSQEEHSSHMDWHVTKNRISKNRKQKPSRKWFVSVSMWLTGAEALGTEAVPGFLPVEDAVEKKDDEEISVPADEDQSTCALCGEPFDDFYSDETDEWMYKGAVYMNAPSGSIAGIDRALLGPIVHAKCRSDSSVGPSEDLGQDEGGRTEEGNQRKRLRP